MTLQYFQQTGTRAKQRNRAKNLSPLLTQWFIVNIVLVEQLTRTTKKNSKQYMPLSSPQSITFKDDIMLGLANATFLQAQKLHQARNLCTSSHIDIPKEGIIWLQRWFNVCSAENYTKPSSNTLLRLVYFFMEWMLE